MHEVFENWSLPWHALQRSLAEAFGADTQQNSPAKPQSLNSRKTAPATSWLLRARCSASLGADIIVRRQSRFATHGRRGTRNECQSADTRQPTATAARSSGTA